MITATTPTVAIRRALLSVSDKQQLLSLAQTLHQLKIEILSTGGTAKLLSEAGIPIIEVANFTDYPEIMDGRVKTLHPKIHGGILARRQQDQAIMQQQQILPIDLVVVNLYPFAQTVQQADCTFAQAIENIDIGGPTMIRAAAKNHQDVTVVVDPNDYPLLIQLLKQHQGAIPFDYRFNLAVKAFEHTAKYDAEIANYFGQHLTAYNTTEQAASSSQLAETKQLFPRTLHMNFTKQQDLRYGENSHQAAALYLTNEPISGSIAHAKQLQGKALSYNNFADGDAALACVNNFTQPSCVIVKHANPCGVASHPNLSEAYLQAFNTDPISAFGGIIAFNRPLDEITAKTIIDKQFVEVIIAPAVTEQAQQLLQTKTNLRVLVTGQASHTEHPGWDFKRINGGLLVQQQDVAQLSMNDWQVVTQQQPTQQQQQDALFAWQVAKFVKSNAIVYAKSSTTLGIGAGQMSRVDSAKIALLKAQQQQLSLANAVMASDAFFPFRDSIEFAAQAGIRCIIQPGGSLRDQEVIAAADEYQIAMLFTGIRHFRH